MGGRIVSTLISFFFALIAQGTISYSVYESLSGYATQFGESLVSGMARSGPLTLGGVALLGSLILEVSLGAMVWGSDVLIVVGSMAGILLVALPMFLLIITVAASMSLLGQLTVFFPALEPPFELSLVVFIVVAVVLVYKSPCIRWAVFVPACVVEELGPVKSLNRSSELTGGLFAKLDILELNWKYFLGTVAFIFWGYLAMVLMEALNKSCIRN